VSISVEIEEVEHRDTEHTEFYTKNLTP